MTNTDEVRSVSSRHISDDDFDRWLEGVKAQAWAEGYAAGQDSVYTAEDEWPNPSIRNPFRFNGEDHIGRTVK